MVGLRTILALLTGLIVLTADAQAQSPEKAPARRTDHYGDPLPEGAILRLGTTRFRHGDEIEDLMFSPRGDLLASVNANRCSLRMWDLRTGKLVWEAKDISSRFGAAVFSPDGTEVALCQTDGSIRIYNLLSGQPKRRLTSPGISYSHPTYSPDGKKLAFVAAKAIFVVWDLETKKEIARFKGQLLSDWTTWRLALTADGRLLACGGREKDEYRYWVLDSAYVWEVSSGKLIAERHGLTIPTRFAAFASKGDKLFLGHKGTLEVWQTGPLQSLRFVTQKDPGFITFALSQDNKLIASASWGGIIRLWDTATLKEVKKLESAGYRVTALAISPDGKVLASAENGIIRLWDLATSKRIDPFRGQETGINSITFAQHGERLISLDGNAIRFWDVVTGKLLHEGIDDGTASGLLALSPNQKLVASAKEGVSVWDVATGKRVHRVPTGASRIDALGWPDDRTLIWAATTVSDPLHSENWIAVWDTKEEKVTRRLALNQQPMWERHQTFRSLSPNSQFLVSCDFIAGMSAFGFASPIHLWNVQEGKKLHQIAGKDIDASIIAFSSDGKMLATPDWSPQLHLWEVATGKEREALSSDEEYRVDSIAFSPDGRLLAVGDPVGYLYLWDLACGKELKCLEGHGRQITCLAFSPDGRLLATGSNDTCILVWDISSITKGQLPALPRSDTSTAALWDELADADAGKAYRAIWKLVAVPNDAVLFLQKSLQPATQDNVRINRLIADLGSDKYAVRKKATEELKELGEQARPALGELLRGQPDAEVRRRAEQLLEEAPSIPSPESLRRLRAIEVLEHIGTPEARALLEKLAKGAPRARLTDEANAALERLVRRTQ